MKILFITSSRIGDAVLSTGLLHYMTEKYPHAKVTIVCGSLAAPLFEGYPLLDKILPLTKQTYSRHWMKLWPGIAMTPWSIVVDLRNTAVSRGVFGAKKYIYGPRIDKKLHKAAQNAQVMKLTTVPAPRLWFTLRQKARAEMLIPDGSSVIGIGPAANWKAKTWPSAGFIEIIEFLSAPGSYFSNARIAVFAAPGEEDVAYKVLKTVPRARQVDVIARANPGESAAALSRCDFYLGNDSGLMHCAAASGVPTIGLFGPSYPEIYRPWGTNAHYVSTPERFDELINYDGYDPKTAPCLMGSLTVDMVKNGIQQFLG